MTRKELTLLLTELLTKEDWIIENDLLYNLMSDLLLELEE